MSKLQRITDDDVEAALDDDGGFRFGVWDIETTSLNASFGHMLMNSVVDLRKSFKPVLRRIDKTSTYKKEMWNDAELCKQVKEDLEKFDVLISYNGYNFDIPFLNSRLVFSGQKILDTRIKHVDLINVTRHRLRLSGGSLDALLTHLQTEQQKTKLEPENWRRAVGGDKKALDEIAIHNIQDVVSLREAFCHLKQFLDIQFRLVR